MNKPKDDLLTLPHEKEIVQHEQTVEIVKRENEQNKLLSTKDLEKMEKKVEKLKKNVYSKLKPLDRVNISRHPNRPKSSDYIQDFCEDFVEIFGDRIVRDDPAVITGFATIGGNKFMVIGQEKGSDTQSRLDRNFGMMHPEGYRKALRCMKLAEKFGLPIISFVDTPGAYPGITAEERGQGFAIAKNLMEMSQIEVPIIVILIGEGCSGGALGVAIGDVIGMLEHSYYSVISPEGCASILWKDAKKKDEAASSLKMQSEDLIDLEVIDEIIPEPMGGAHYDVEKTYKQVKQFILKKLEQLKNITKQDLLERRFQKFRKMGKVSLENHETSG